MPTTTKLLQRFLFSAFLLPVIFLTAGGGRCCWAVENISWPTYYPSPYGSYAELIVTETTNIASTTNSNLTLASGNGARVAIGDPLTVTHTLEVAAPINGTTGGSNTFTAVFIGPGTTYGLGIGGYKIGGVVQSYGLLQALQGGAAAALSINPGGQHVGIGNNATNLASSLQVGAATISLSQGAGPLAPLKVNQQGGDPNYYAVYAPG